MPSVTFSDCGGIGLYDDLEAAFKD